MLPGQQLILTNEKQLLAEQSKKATTENQDCPAPDQGNHFVSTLSQTAILGRCARACAQRRTVSHPGRNRKEQDIDTSHA